MNQTNKKETAPNDLLFCAKTVERDELFERRRNANASKFNGPASTRPNATIASPCTRIGFSTYFLTYSVLTICADP